MMESRQEDLGKYGKKFQENLVRLIMEDRVFADQMLEVLDINFLELKYLQVFVEKIFIFSISLIKSFQFSKSFFIFYFP